MTEAPHSPVPDSPVPDSPVPDSPIPGGSGPGMAAGIGSGGVDPAVSDVTGPMSPGVPDPTVHAVADPTVSGITAPSGSGEPFLADRREEDAAVASVSAREAKGPRFQWPSAVVLIGLVASLLIVATDHFRRGSVLFAAFVLIAFFLRLILSDRDAGWLAVRSRVVDLLCLGVLGGSLSVFALIVPPPS